MAALDSANGVARRLAVQARAVLAEGGVEIADVNESWRVELRYVGVDETLAVPLGPYAAVRDAFHAAHRRRFGFARTEDPIELVSVRVHVSEPAQDERDEAPSIAPSHAAPEPLATSDVWFADADAGVGILRHDTPVFALADLEPGAAVDGPALVVDDVTTVVVEPGFRLARLDSEILEISPREFTRAPQATARRDPLHLALFANAFASIAERMGAMLERVAHSTSIKERLDFSCALFDADGRLLVSAPHVPVHLGAMGESVRAIRASRDGGFHEGDAIVTNDPYRGGSHLPDITLVTPVMVEDGRARFFVANRAHHGDVGGVTPGSMPPLSRRIDEEGVCLHDLLLVRDGRLDEDAARTAFASGAHPARNVGERLSDLRAQSAANAEGARLLRELVEVHGAEVVGAYAAHVLDDAAEAMEELLRSLPDGDCSAVDRLDDGTPLCVRIAVTGGRAVVDFAGTGDRVPGNLNAPRAVTRAAVLFALRLLVPRPVPLNEGCLQPIEIRIPAGSLLDPVSPCAVVGGNVETSMRLVDLVLSALGACAGGQGTMNNVTFAPSDGGPTYYETIGGGTGAGPDFDGAASIQSHMTNTRITDPEVLEIRHPVVLRRFAVRMHSGGRGARCGGDGSVREIEARVPLRGGILSGRRERGGPGLAGGEDGAAGRNVVLRADGREEVLAGAATFDLAPGDALRVETPGGGGYGGPPR